MISLKYTAGERLRAGFTAVPNDVLRDPRLSGNAKCLYALMLDCAWRQLEPELPELGALLGGGKKTAATAIAQLGEVGYVTVKRRGQGKTNAYVINDPTEVQKGPEGTSRESPREPASTKDLGEDRTVEADASTVRGGEVSTRKRNVVFDAIVKATNANPADGGKIGKAIKDIRTAAEVGLREMRESFLAAAQEYDEVPAEVVDQWLVRQIEQRAAAYRRLRPEWELTPTALASHWNRIPTWKSKQSGKMSAAEIARMEE